MSFIKFGKLIPATIIAGGIGFYAWVESYSDKFIDGWGVLMKAQYALLKREYQRNPDIAASFLSNGKTDVVSNSFKAYLITEQTKVIKAEIAASKARTDVIKAEIAAIDAQLRANLHETNRRIVKSLALGPQKYNSEDRDAFLSYLALSDGGNLNPAQITFLRDAWDKNAGADKILDPMERVLLEEDVQEYKGFSGEQSRVIKDLLFTP